MTSLEPGRRTHTLTLKFLYKFSSNSKMAATFPHLRVRTQWHKGKAREQSAVTPRPVARLRAWNVASPALCYKEQSGQERQQVCININVCTNRRLQ